jgi:NADP-reducing hydrogenase subunit HndB
MIEVKSLDDLNRLKEEALDKHTSRITTDQTQITVGMGACSIAAGARDTMETIREVIREKGLNGIIVNQVGCVGLCGWEPIVEVRIANGPTITYGKVSSDRARRIMQEHIIEARLIPEYVIPTL